MQIAAVRDQRKIKITPPIESHFDQPEIVQEADNYKNVFGLNNDCILPEQVKDGDFGCFQDNRDNSVAKAIDQLNDFLDDDSSNVSSDDQPDQSDCSDTSTEPPSRLSEEQRNRAINSSKSMEELCTFIQSLRTRENFNPNVLFFAKSTLFHAGLVSSRESARLDSILSNYKMSRISIPPNGNCFFLSVAHVLKDCILGLINSHDLSEMCCRLRELIVYEWMSHPESYQPFFAEHGQALHHEAQLSLNDGHFASELGNSMPLAMANLLKLPIAVISQMENLPVVPITPRETLQCLPIVVAFDHSGAGHYDAVTKNVKGAQLSSETESLTDKKGDTDIGLIVAVDKVQKEKRPISLPVITSKKRCKCFQGIIGCSENCQCQGCQNPYGKRKKSEQNIQTTKATTKKRRRHEMTSESLSGKQFLLKRPYQVSVHKWTLMEELALVQLVQYGLTTGADKDIDMGIITLQVLTAC